MKNFENQTYPEIVHEVGEVDTAEFVAEGSTVKIDFLKIEKTIATAQNPVIVIPGFTEGITQDARFAESLSDDLNTNTYVVGQYHREEKKRLTAQEALSNQAEAVLAVIEKQGLKDKSVDIFANSLGAVVFSEVARLAHEKGWSCFDPALGSKVVLMAPSGIKQDDTAMGVAYRFAVNAAKSHLKTEHGWDEDSLKAGGEIVSRDKRKAIGEMVLALKGKIDFTILNELGIKPMVLTSPNDNLMGQDALGQSIEELLMSGNLDSWASPYSTETLGLDGLNEEELSQLTKKERDVLKFSGNSGREHNSHMVNQKQADGIAGAVAAKLKVSR